MLVALRRLSSAARRLCDYIPLAWRARGFALRRGVSENLVCFNLPPLLTRSAGTNCCTMAGAGGSSCTNGAAEDGRVMLLVFGDSYVADPLVPRTWPILLADRLGWRSANFAAPGYVENTASAAQAAEWPRVAEARGSLRHALARKGASGAADRGLSRLVFDAGAW